MEVIIKVINISLKMSGSKLLHLFYDNPSICYKSRTEDKIKYVPTSLISCSIVRDIFFSICNVVGADSCSAFNTVSTYIISIKQYLKYVLFQTVVCESWHVDSFLRPLRCPPPIQLTAMI